MGFNSGFKGLSTRNHQNISVRITIHIAEIIRYVDLKRSSAAPHCPSKSRILNSSEEIRKAQKHQALRDLRLSR